MNPIANCCLYYWSAIMVIGVVFFTILLILQASESEYMTPKFGASRDDQIATLTWAILFNLIWFGICFVAIIKQNAAGSRRELDSNTIKFYTVDNDSD